MNDNTTDTTGQRGATVTMRYQIGSPNGFRGSYIDAASNDEAVTKAEAAPYRETVLDLMDSQDESGSPLILLVVAD